MKRRTQEYTQKGRSNVEEFDLLVLGSGTGGKLISWTLAKAGMKIANIERKYVGGSCQNIAFLPSKNVIHSAKMASYFRRSEEFGITQGELENQHAGSAGAQAQDGQGPD